MDNLGDGEDDEPEAQKLPWAKVDLSETWWDVVYGYGNVLRVSMANKGGQMNHQAFTNDSLAMMYEGIRGALAADDTLSGLGEEPRFRVRETHEWKLHAADLEAEMHKRGMTFDLIDWSEDQAEPPLEE